jgi:hypothetical protein
METSVIEKLETYLIASGKELIRHNMLIKQHEITNTRSDISDKGEFWKNRWWRLNFIKFNYLFLVAPDKEAITKSKPVIVCYKWSQFMKIPIFSSLWSHIWTEGHKNSNILWHEAKWDMPERLYFPTTKLCVLKELESDAMYMVREIKMGHIVLRTLHNNSHNKSSKSSAEVYNDLFK